MGLFDFFRKKSPPVIVPTPVPNVVRPEQPDEMYFDCPFCGHAERLNDVGKSVYNTNPFMFKDFNCTACKKSFDAGPRMKFGPCPNDSKVNDALINSPAVQVTFKRKWTKPNIIGTLDTYEEYTAPTAAAAQAYLNTRHISEAQFYVIVETPEGCWGKDRAGIYQE